MKEIMLCHIGPQQVGIDIAHIKAVHRVADAASSSPGPFSSRDASKVCLLDSKETDLYELHQLFGGGPSPDADTVQKVLTIQTAGRQVGFCVDQIERVIEAEENRMIPLPAAFKRKAARWFPTVLKRGDSLIPLLDPRCVAAEADEQPNASSPPDRRLTAWGEKMIPGKWLADLMIESVQRHLKQSVDNEIDKIKRHRRSIQKWRRQSDVPHSSSLRKDHRRNRVLIFQADSPRCWGKPVYFIFSLRQICEIIPHLPVFPIPFAPPHVQGMVWWRQHVAPVISLEACLGLQDSFSSPAARLMAVRLRKKDAVLMIKLNTAVHIVPTPEAHPVLSHFLGLKNSHLLHGVYGWDEGFLVAAHIENITDLYG